MEDLVLCIKYQLKSLVSGTKFTQEEGKKTRKKITKSFLFLLKLKLQMKLFFLNRNHFYVV